MHNELTKNDIKKMEDEIEYRVQVVRKQALEDVYEVNAFDTKKMKELLLEAVPRKSVTVIIAQAPCVLRKRHRE